MLLTTSAKTTLPQHSTGWRALRLISDRGGKSVKTGPADWIKAQHRRHSLEESLLIIEHRATVIRHIARLREHRP